MWGLYGRYFEGGRWSETQRITGDAGPNLYHAVVRDSNGNVHVVWQAFRGGHSQILTKAWNGQQWSAEIQVSTGTMALNGTPATAAFHTAPLPSETPSAPIDELPVRARSQA